MFDSVFDAVACVIYFKFQIIYFGQHGP